MGLWADVARGRRGGLRGMLLGTNRDDDRDASGQDEHDAAQAVSRARMLPGGLASTSGAYRLCGHDLTTGNRADAATRPAPMPRPSLRVFPDAVLIA